MIQLTATWVASAWLATAAAQTPVETTPPSPTPPTSPRTAEGPEASAARAALAAEAAAKAARSMAESSERIATALERMSTPGAVPVAPELAPAAEPPAVDASAAGWTGSLGLHFIALTGNASTLTASTNAALERKSDNWIYALRASGAYGQAQTTESDEAAVTALQGVLQLRGDRRFGKTASAFLLAGAETDHVKSIEVRGYGEAGLGLIWIDDVQGTLERAFFRTDLALRVGQEYRFQYYPTPLDLDDIPIAAPRFGVTFRYALSDEIRFIQQAEILPNLIGNNSVLVSSTSKLTARLIDPISLGVGFRVDHDSRPAPGKVPTDTQLTVGIEVAI